ncbi:hypothetical protein [Parasitella parasitica]|uniref:Uncharacterized protein n=1 Tax=Parasitella parasitica TaxID=35722 RepID=A0A0B7NRL8_9FUNG|nr:hypothetical protein [Parasitella parasitica]
MSSQDIGLTRSRTYRVSPQERGNLKRLSSFHINPKTNNSVKPVCLSKSNEQVKFVNNLVLNQIVGDGAISTSFDAVSETHQTEELPTAKLFRANAKGRSSLCRMIPISLWSENRLQRSKDNISTYALASTQYDSVDREYTGLPLTGLGCRKSPKYNY